MCAGAQAPRQLSADGAMSHALQYGGAGSIEATIRARILHHETKIGDSLCTIPVILQIAALFGTAVYVEGAFSTLVRPLVSELPMIFGATDYPASPIDFDIEIQAAYNLANARNEHMAIALCRLAGLDLPELPVGVPLVEQQTGQPEGIVISPFSGSLNSWYKLWPLEHWMAVIIQLVRRLGGTPVYVIGGQGDQWDAFVGTGIVRLIDLPLTKILSTLRSAKVFLSIDNGMSHLAHFGGVHRHVLLYPAITAPNVAVNPRANVLIGRPEDIAVSRVVAAAMDMLA